MKIPLLNKQGGFTLLEILAALAIAAIGFAATSHGLSASIQAATGLDNRMIASWVAGNKLTWLQIRHDWPVLGEEQFSRKMTGRTWYLLQRVTTTLDKELHRIDIEVYEDPERRKKIASLFGFLAAPQQRLPLRVDGS